MKNFTSCGLPWYPWPADGKCPCEPEQHVRILTRDEVLGNVKYDNTHDEACCWAWSGVDRAGWYPVNPDGTEITPRPRVLRPRFKLSTR